MEREHVALAQQPAELDPSGAGGPLELGPRAARRVEDPHPERHRPAAHRLADASGPEQAERPALELDPEQLLRMPAGPRVALHELDPLQDAPGAREDQHPGEVGGRVGQDVGVFVTLMPRSSAATTSTLSCPTAQLAMILSLGRCLSSVPPTQRDKSGTIAT